MQACRNGLLIGFCGGGGGWCHFEVRWSAHVSVCTLRGVNLNQEFGHFPASIIMHREAGCNSRRFLYTTDTLTFWDFH